MEDLHDRNACSPGAIDQRLLTGNIGGKPFLAEIRPVPEGFLYVDHDQGDIIFGHFMHLHVLNMWR